MILDHPKCKAYGLNERVFTLDYTEWVCTKEKIVLKYEPTLWPGLYFIRRRRPTIIINPLASAAEQLLALLHELGHHFRHSPKMCFYQPKYLGKPEYEAEEFAAYAAIPYYLITSKLPWEIQEEFGYSTEILGFRKELFEQLTLKHLPQLLIRHLRETQPQPIQFSEHRGAISLPHVPLVRLPVSIVPPVTPRTHRVTVP